MAYHVTQVQGIKYPKWEQDYQAALLETDRPAMKVKIQRAEAALFARTVDRNDPPDDDKRIAMEHAAHRLRATLVEVLGYPDHGKWKIPLERVK